MSKPTTAWSLPKKTATTWNRPDIESYDDSTTTYDTFETFYDGIGKMIPVSQWKVNSAAYANQYPYDSATNPYDSATKTYDGVVSGQTPGTTATPTTWSVL